MVSVRSGEDIEEDISLGSTTKDDLRALRGFCGIDDYTNLETVVRNQF